MGPLPVIFVLYLYISHQTSIGVASWPDLKNGLSYKRSTTFLRSARQFERSNRAHYQRVPPRGNDIASNVLSLPNDTEELLLRGESINELDGALGDDLKRVDDTSFFNSGGGLYPEILKKIPQPAQNTGKPSGEFESSFESLIQKYQNPRNYDTYQALQPLVQVSNSKQLFSNKHQISSVYANGLNGFNHMQINKPSTSSNGMVVDSSNGGYLSSHSASRNHPPISAQASSPLSMQRLYSSSLLQSSLDMHDQDPDLSHVDFSGSSMCGKQLVGAREPRIVGGNSTYDGEFPWAVSIQRHGNHHCGGVIVGKRWVLTAAHCVRTQIVGNLLVRTGGHLLSRSSNSLNSHLERDYKVEQIIMHDDFSRYEQQATGPAKGSPNANNADIALLKLKDDINWNELAWPVCFPNKDAGSFSGRDAIVIGWGKLNEKSEDFSNELQKVKLTIIDNKVCQNWFRQAGREMPIDERIICAGFKSGGKDACHGDSGGPLLSRINGHYVVVGVVSTGIGCARPLLPGLYSRVSSYLGWIERHVT